MREGEPSPEQDREVWERFTDPDPFVRWTALRLAREIIRFLTLRNLFLDEPSPPEDLSE